ncbi:F-box protein At2g39490-like [Punica granatum]|uniref:Uncharacterized protein n=2 Tax=Punica granatum TaxID=22663 RepID=A0A218XCV8_PUNGR|nr:F-box protein At2g39490-like [Punica granatum]OWM82341.1 hypothetical protein CDL15_Pgr001915 [Punica granatum]PKI62131.1 hypothetical protein CRG98_017504 [Punica granatum]
MEDQARSDSISSLPDDILRRISCSIPLKEAARTTILSTRWRTLWAPSRLNVSLNMDSNTNFGAVQDMVEDSVQVLVSTFLGSYEAPEARKLCFAGIPGANHEPPSGSEHELITITAIKGVEKELHLQFSKNIWECRSFHLKLGPALGTANLTELRRLHLRSVASLGSGFVSNLFSCCHILESLILEKCPGLETIAIDKNSSLQELAISNCPDLGRVSVCALELKSFRYQGALPKIELKSTSNLAEVALNLRDGSGPGEFDCEEVLSLLDSMKEVEFLTISGWLLEWLCSAGVIYGKLEFQFSRLKELRWADSSMNSTKRDSLACFLNICPVLNKLFIDVDHSLGMVHCPILHQHWHEPHLWRDYDTVKSDVLPLKHLKAVRMGLGHLASEEDRLSLMELLLEKAVILESMSVIT